MTRREEILQHAIERGCIEGTAEYYGFLQGAEWADAHQLSPWISIKDKLPKNYVPVLVRLSTNIYDVGVFKYDSQGDFLFCVCGGLPDIYVSDKKFSLYRVTDWMPIPEPLK